VEVGRIHLVYGLPGVSRIVHDRDFVLRAVRVLLPSGVCVLCCRSVGADEGREGDPGPGRHMVRCAHGVWCGVVVWWCGVEWGCGVVVWCGVGWGCGVVLLSSSG